MRTFTSPLAGIDPGNWLLAAGVAVGSYVILHGAVVLFRHHLAKLSEQAGPTGRLPNCSRPPWRVPASWR